VVQVQVIPLAGLLVLLVLWPRVAWPFEDSLNDVDKAGITQNLLVLFIILEWTTNLRGGLIEKAEEFR
jgi:hypothetical protein